MFNKLYDFIITVDVAAVALDTRRGHIYWSAGVKYNINRAALDGSNPEVVVGKLCSPSPWRFGYVLAVFLL